MGHPDRFPPTYGHYRSDRPHDREREDAPHGPHTGRTGAPPTAALIPSRITDPRPSPLGRAHFPTSPPAEITARKFGVYTRSGFNGMSGDDAAEADSSNLAGVLNLDPVTALQEATA